MHQYEVVGIITEIFTKDSKPFAKISIPKWQLTNSGKYIIREWIERGWSKPEEDFLLLSEGIELAHLEPSEMPEPTTENKVELLIDKAFGTKGKRLGINIIYYPEGLIISPGICVHENCDQPRTHLTWHNCWGTVQAFPCCEVHHKELNGRCSDSFPLKTELARKTA